MLPVLLCVIRRSEPLQHARMGAPRPSREWQQRRAAARAANSAPLSLFNTAHPLQFAACNNPAPRSGGLAAPAAATLETPAARVL